MTSSNSFYVTRFSNASQEIYENNTHADFTVKLSRTIDLGNPPNLEVGVCEVSFSTPPLEYLNSVEVMPCADHTIIYFNLISPQFVGGSTFCCLLTFPTSSCRYYEFRNVQYVQVEQRRFQSIRVEFLTLEGPHVPFEDSTTPTKPVFYFRKYYLWKFLL